MKLVSNFIKTIAKKHAEKFANNISIYDPLMQKAVLNKIDSKISLFLSKCPEINLNTEVEAMQDIALNGIGLGFLDNIIDVLKYGYYALKGGKYKISEYLCTYRQELTNNIRPSSFDLRKGDINEQEVNNILKKIFS